MLHEEVSARKQTFATPCAVLRAENMHECSYAARLCLALLLLVSKLLLKY
jgi:hypothetical protein